MQAFAFGGIPPYTFSWSTGDVGQTIIELAPGDYTVTVTDGMGATAQTTGSVEAVWALDTDWDLPELQADCNNSCTGMVQVMEQGFYGTPPYAYTQDPVNGSWGLVYENICSGVSQVVQVLDANGCPGSFDLGELVNTVQTGYVEVLNITPACAGEANGTLTVRLMGGSVGAYLFVGNGMGFYQTYYPAQGQPFTVTGMPAGSYGVSALQNGIEGNPICTAQYPQVISELPSPCATVSGTVFNDVDQDCSQGPDDVGLPYRVLTIEPGPTYAITDQNGAYYSALSFGSYTLAQPLVDEAQLCPVAQPVAFAVNGSDPNATIDLADSSFVPHDLEVTLQSTAFRPGFGFNLWGVVTNNTAYPSGALSISLGYPTLLDPVTASNGGTAVGGTGSWSLAPVPAYSQRYFGLQGVVPPDVGLLGQVLSFPTQVSNGISESDLGNNTAVLERTVTGSYDPNDKVGTTNNSGSNTLFLIDQDEWIDYTIRFQNTGTDTAFTVVIRDTIDTDLHIPSLEIVGSSHTFIPSFGDERELTFTFNSIVLPDSSTDLLGSQGFIRFRIKPVQAMLPGTVIENVANIYFDFNEPVITEPSVLVAEFSTGIRAQSIAPSVFPNPASDQLFIRWRTPIAELYSWAMISSEGRILDEGTRASDEAVFDTANLVTGLYFLRVFQGSRTFTLPFTKTEQ
jgi:uncharacterized repeat protein (TIGR01451 family)